MIFEVKDFQFRPPQLKIALTDTLTIKILRNTTESGLYCQDRFFIFSIIPCKNQQPNYDEEFETPPLKEAQTYNHVFSESGDYLIQCVNQVPFKAMVSVGVEKSCEKPVIEEQKEQPKAKKVDPYAPQNREQKLFGQSPGPLIDPNNYITYLRENDGSIDAIINQLDQIEKSIFRQNSCLDTQSTINSSFQFQSEPQECYQQQIFVRKHSDPLVMHKPVDLSPLIEKKLSWQERAVQLIKRKKDLTEIESIDWSDKWRNTRDILNYLETEFQLILT